MDRLDRAKRAITASFRHSYAMVVFEHRALIRSTIYKSIIGDESRPSHNTQGETVQVQTKRRGRGPSEHGANWTRAARWSTLGVS